MAGSGVAQAAEDLAEQSFEQEDTENAPSFWVSFKRWVLSHKKKYSAIAYGIFLSIFSLVVLKSQVILSCSFSADQLLIMQSPRFRRVPVTPPTF